MKLRIIVYENDHSAAANVGGRPEETFWTFDVEVPAAIAAEWAKNRSNYSVRSVVGVEVIADGLPPGLKSTRTGRHAAPELGRSESEKPAPARAAKPESPKPTPHDWDKYIEPLVEDVRASAQLSSEDYAIRINARNCARIVREERETLEAASPSIAPEPGVRSLYDELADVRSEVRSGLSLLHRCRTEEAYAPLERAVGLLTAMLDFRTPPLEEDAPAIAAPVPRSEISGAGDGA